MQSKPKDILKNIKEEWEVLNNHVNQIEKLMGARSTFGDCYV